MRRTQDVCRVRRAGAAFAAALSIGLNALILQTAHAQRDYIEGEVLVTFRGTADSVAAQRAADRHALRMARHFRLQSQPQPQSFALLKSSKRTTAELVAELSQDPTVEIVEPNYLRYPCALRRPNDPLLDQLWALENSGQVVNGSSGTPGADIAFRAAWGMARPSTNEVVVAILDTGVDHTHPDLVSNMWINPGEIAGNLVDDDGDGYVDDVNGYDFADHDGDPMDANNHGTHVAGTVAASGNNSTGVIGVAFKARIMALKASSDGESLPTSALIEAIEYATAMKTRGVNVVAINASYTGSTFSAQERKAIQAARNAGIVFCAAAGNETADNDVTAIYPANYNVDNIIVVAATDQDDQLAGFSNYGATSVDIAAPGVNIRSALPGVLADTTASVQHSTNLYPANGLEYASATPGITATLYDCGLGYPSNFPPEVEGNIACIERGTLFFSEKVSNAMAAGAVAAVVYNNVSGNFSGTLQSAGPWIPAVSISQAHGEALLPLLPDTVTVLNRVNPATSYQFLSGTSMAAPHVAGAVAFSALNFPDETLDERIQRVLSNGTPLSNLQGVVSTGARLNLSGTVDTDGNGLPDWWEQIFFHQVSGTDPNDDPDKDRSNNLQESLIGTDPMDSESVLQFTAIRRTASNSTTIQWPSIEGKYYRLLGDTNPLTALHHVIRTNIAATPPLNTEIDTNSNAAMQFYILQLEP